MRTKEQIKDYNKSYYPKNKKKIIKQVRDNFKKKSLEEKREIYKKRNEYSKLWFNNKYKTDPVFRQKYLERVKRNNKKRR
jgi:hypothetical protein